MNSNKLAITDLVLRDAHQSLLATRMRIEDMLPIAAKLDKVGYWSLETFPRGRPMGTAAAAEGGHAQYSSANAASGAEYSGLSSLW